MGILLGDPFPLSTPAGGATFSLWYYSGLEVFVRDTDWKWLASLAAAFLLLCGPLPAADGGDATMAPPGQVAVGTPAIVPGTERISERLFGLPGLTNIGRMAPGILRGAQPEREGFATLKAMGIRTVINLRTRHGEREAVEAAGMRYVEIPMSFWKDVDPAVVRMALSVMTDPVNQPVFVHCSRGVDRTGVVAAVYRMEVDGWSEAEAEAEMEAFGFHEIWSQLKEYVRRYPGVPKEVREEVRALDGP
jgi:tyrosine-protein phosphatase SIW14